MRRYALVVAGALAAGALVGVPMHAPPAQAAPGCAAAPSAGSPITVVVGTVSCQSLYTDVLGPHITAPFAYDVPPQCAPSAGVQCPVLYLLHGFGGDFTEMVGTASQPSAWISALTSRPEAGFESSPWTNADPSTWQSAPALSMILVAPRGQTLPGGYGPAPGLDSYWTDWNPRYAAGGDSQRYATPAPQFESYLIGELLPFVEANFPTGRGRQWRAIGGVSLGGFGAYKLGLQHPDAFSAMLSVSGAHNFLFAPGIDPRAVPGADDLPAGVQPPVATPTLRLPGATGVVPTGVLPSQAGTFLTALDAFGDPAADQGYYRGNMPRDLALNARASTAGIPALGIDGFVNDTVPRRPQDIGDVTAQAFEDIVLPMNVDMEAAFASEGVANTFAVHQGLHSDVYRNAWFRGLEEFAWSQLAHPDAPSPTRGPTVFDYRSIRNDFSAWGWQFHVDRTPVEFLTLRSVSCSGLTLQGTGTVTVTVPTACGTAADGSQRRVIVDLGPPSATDEPAGAGAIGAYGRTRTVRL